jgi:hypothetical protein
MLVKVVLKIRLPYTPGETKEEPADENGRHIRRDLKVNIRPTTAASAIPTACNNPPP